MSKIFLKKFIPPIVLEVLKGKPRYGYFGKYATWQMAMKDSSGYDNLAILEKVKDSLLKVKNGQAMHERDSVILSTIEYSWPVLAGLLWIASLNKNSLDVLDFGGSLGSSYFQNRIFLKHIDLKWNIVEQKNFVDVGKKFFEGERLKFMYNIHEIKSTNNSVFMASSSLQYLEKPYELVNSAIEMGFPYIIIDRTVFLPDSERICVQKVRPEIYDASYPVWALNEKKFLELFASSYTLITDFQAIGTKSIPLGDANAYQKGFIFKRR